MIQFRYINTAVFCVAVVVVFFLDVPAWERIIVLAWAAIPILINESQLRKKHRDQVEMAAHSTDSVPDRQLHAYRESR